MFSVDLGHLSDPDVERALIDEVGSYGKQLGHLAEAREVVIDEFGLMGRALAPEKRDALQVFLADVAAARRLKPPKASATPRPVMPPG